MTMCEPRLKLNLAQFCRIQSVAWPTSETSRRAPDAPICKKAVGVVDRIL